MLTRRLEEAIGTVMQLLGVRPDTEHPALNTVGILFETMEETERAIAFHTGELLVGKSMPKGLRLALATALIRHVDAALYFDDQGVSRLQKTDLDPQFPVLPYGVCLLRVQREGNKAIYRFIREIDGEVGPFYWSLGRMTFTISAA